MEYKTALIDTSFLVSMFVGSDASISKTAKIAAKLADYAKLYITNLIYIETATILSQRLGKPAFSVCEKELRSLNLNEIFISISMDMDVRKLFGKIKQKDISYVDVSSAYVTKEKNITYVISYDKHFKYLRKQFGFKLLGV